MLASHVRRASGQKTMASGELEEHDNSRQYADVDGKEDASTNRERGNCHWPASFDPHAKHGMRTCCSEVLDN